MLYQSDSAFEGSAALGASRCTDGALIDGLDVLGQVDQLLALVISRSLQVVSDRIDLVKILLLTFHSFDELCVFGGFTILAGLL